MPTLRSLGVHPDLRKLLATAEPPIETPQALLSRDPGALAAIVKVPSLRQMDDLRAAVADALIAKTPYGSRALRVTASAESENNSSSSRNSSVPLIVGATTAADLLAHQTSRMERREGIATGSQQLDQLLAAGQQHDGGLQFGHVTQVTGPPGACKTQLALSLAKHHASQGRSVHYLASGYGHGTLLPLTRRLQHFCTHDNFQTILQNVAFTKVSTGREALLVLQRLMQEEADGGQENTTEPALLILDSASGCLSGDLYHEGGTVVAQQVGFSLRTLARHCGMAVLVTNGTVSGNGVSGASSKAAMGNKWDVADISLWLQGEEDDTDGQPHASRSGMPLDNRQHKVVRVRLTEDRTAPSSSEVEKRNTICFAVTVDGVCDVPHSE